MSESDFDKLPRGGIHLGVDGKKKFFTQFEKMMGQYASDTDMAGKKKGFRAQIQQRIAELAKRIRFEHHPTMVKQPIA